MSGGLSPALEDVRAQLEAASAGARGIVAGLPQDLVGRRPGPASWSVAECLRHLALTTDAFVPAIREALAEGRGRNLLSSGQSFQMNVVARLLAWWLEPPYRVKSRTSAPFVPGPGDPAMALPEFLQGQQQLFDLLTEADGLAIDRLRIASPFARQIRYSVYSGLVLIAVHQRRHVWQAQQVARKVTRGAGAG